MTVDPHEVVAAERRQAPGSEWPGIPAPAYDSARRPPAAIEELLELWRYRDLVVQLVRRDVVARYKRSLFGVAWTMLNPLGTMIVLTMVFSQAFGTLPAYAAYVLTGLLAWTFFAQTTLSAMRQLVWGAGLLHRVYVPRTVFAVTAVGTGLVNLTLSLVPLALVLTVTGLRPWPSALFVPVAILLLAAFALGVGLLLSTLAAHFVDVAELYEMALPLILYLTPIIYPEEILPAALRRLVVPANPLHHLIVLFRQPLYEGTWPAPQTLALGALWALVTLGAGWVIFTSRADEFPYRV